MPDAYCLYKVFAHVQECVAKVYTLARTLACPIAVYHVAVGQGLHPSPHPGLPDGCVPCCGWPRSRPLPSVACLPSPGL